jgi:hypothetical protein
MICIKGRCENRRIQSDEPVELPDGTEVMIEIHPVSDITDEGWRELGMGRLESEWDNPKDALYDNWRELYGV